MPLAPEVQAHMDSLATQDEKPLQEMTVAQARALSVDLADWSGPAPQMARCEEVMLPVSGGEIGLQVLIPHGTPRAVLMFIHGGGWVIGSAAQSEGLCRRLAEQSGAIVVNVDYRLAPEYPFPVPVDDCMAALDWTAARFAGLPLFVGGDSAGGNLSVVVGALARDRGAPEIRGLALIYPVADCDLTRPSYLAQDNQHILTTPGMEWFWNHYLPDPGQRHDPRASPLRGAHAGLPQSCVVIAEYDVLCDEVEALAAAMETAGVPVERMPAPGFIHGFFGWGGVLPSAETWVGHVGRWISARS